MLLVKHICLDNCCYDYAHTATNSTDNKTESIYWYTENVRRINNEFGHIVVYFTPTKHICLNCDIWYELKYFIGRIFGKC